MHTTVLRYRSASRKHLWPRHFYGAAWSARKITLLLLGEVGRSDAAASAQRRKTPPGLRVPAKLISKPSILLKTGYSSLRGGINNTKIPTLLRHPLNSVPAECRILVTDGLGGFVLGRSVERLRSFKAVPAIYGNPFRCGA